MGLLSQGLRPVRGAVSLGGRLGQGAADAAGRTAIAGLDALLEWRYTDEAVRRVLASPVADRAIGHALSGPLVEAALARAEATDLPQRVIDSRLLDAVVDRLLESEELWLLVDEIANSPAVTEAIGQQSVGFADQVAGQVRLRSQRADATMERVARRLLRRQLSGGSDG